ncbi:unnamed protein product [Symbiodinium microadriaticum]|nr:unnamed protein product [Symbiodinium microadriaticum]CAE7946111.1 unnamed protein product [Symbiodinium sp. KB8]
MSGLGGDAQSCAILLVLIQRIEQLLHALNGRLRASGKRPRQQDLSVLRSHHSYHMGGGGRRKQWSQQEWRDWQSSEHWQLWRGAKQSASPKAKANAIPLRYDSMPVEQPRVQTSLLPTGEEYASTGDADLNREIQKSLTVAKKADVRLRKLQEEKARRAVQWEAYATDVRNKFLAQRKQFEQDRERLQTEMVATMETGQEASAHLRRVVDQGVPARMEVTEEDNAAWAALTTPSQEPAPSGFLREAMSAVHAARRSPPGLEATAPTAGQGLVTQEAAAQLLAAVIANMPNVGAPTGMAAPGGTHGPPPAPYVPSPSTRRPEAAEAPSPTPTQSKASPPKREPRVRVPVKGAPLQPVHTGVGLAGSLGAKLDMRRNAMAPFGNPDALAATLPFTLNGQPTKIATDIDTDDDVDLESKEETGEARPPDGPTCYSTQQQGLSEWGYQRYGLLRRRRANKTVCLGPAAHLLAFDFAVPDRTVLRWACTDVPPSKRDISATSFSPVQQERGQALTKSLRPQQFLGLMDVISYHSCLDFLPTPHKAVVLDLSRVGGHCHATILPTRMTWEDLAYKVHRLLNVDIFEDPVGIWQGETLEPVMRNSTIVLQHGDTLVFMLSEYGPPRGFKADDFFNQDTRWYGFQHLLSCRNTKHIAVCTTSELFPIDPHYFQHLPDQELALHVTELEGASHRVTEVDMAPTLELDRKSCSKLRTVTETVIDSGNPDAQIEANYLLDLRPLCQCPKLVTFRNAWPDLPEILNVADITFPPGQCGDLLQNRVFGTVQVLPVSLRQRIWSPSPPRIALTAVALLLVPPLDP